MDFVWDNPGEPVPEKNIHPLEQWNEENYKETG